MFKSGSGFATGAAMLAACALVAVGCGGDEGSSSAGGQGAAAESGGGSEKLKQFEAKIESDVAAAMKQDPAKVPSSGPKAAPNKRVFVISCGEAIEGCARGTRGFVAALKDIGWKYTSIDTEANPTKALAGIRQAISQGADGILINAFDSSTIGGPVKQATDAGLKVVATNAVDPDGVFSDLLPEPKSFEDEGYLMGQALYRATKGNLKLVIFSGDEFAVVKGRRIGTERFIKDCKAAGGDCEIVNTTAVPASTLATSFPSNAASTLRNRPNATAVWTGFDAMPPLAIQGLRQAGITKVAIVGFDANKPNIEIIKEGGMQKATTVKPSEWLSYQAVDNLNRLLAEEDPMPLGTTPRLLTTENVPADGDVLAAFFPDFEPAYRKLWGR